MAAQQQRMEIPAGGIADFAKTDRPGNLSFPKNSSTTIHGSGTRFLLNYVKRVLKTQSSTL